LESYVVCGYRGSHPHYGEQENRRECNQFDSLLHFMTRFDINWRHLNTYLCVGNPAD
jgi:hypothetical protein